MGKKDGDDDGGPEIVQMTQEALDGLFAARANRAAGNREKEILDKLGFASVDEAFEQLNELREKVNTAASEHEETVTDLNSQLEEAQTSLTTLQKQVRTNALRKEIAELMPSFGFVDASKDDVYSYFEKDDLPEGVEIDDETMEVKGVKEVLESLAEAKPHWTVSQQAMTRTPGRRVQTPPASAAKDELDTYRIKM